MIYDDHDLRRELDYLPNLPVPSGVMDWGYNTVSLQIRIRDLREGHFGVSQWNNHPSDIPKELAM
jgi:hypothetical protein